MNWDVLFWVWVGTVLSSALDIDGLGASKSVVIRRVIWVAGLVGLIGWGVFR